jgi:hypothetical protein
MGSKVPASLATARSKKFGSGRVDLAHLELCHEPKTFVPYQQSPFRSLLSTIPPNPFGFSKGHHLLFKISFQIVQNELTRVAYHFVTRPQACSLVWARNAPLLPHRRSIWTRPQNFLVFLICKAQQLVSKRLQPDSSQRNVSKELSPSQPAPSKNFRLRLQALRFNPCTRGVETVFGSLVSGL